MKKRVNIKYYKQKIMALTMSGLMLVSNTGCFKIKDNKDKIDIKNNTSIEYVQNEKNNFETVYIFNHNNNVEIDYERIPKNIWDQIDNFENTLKEYDPNFDVNEYRKIVNETNFVDTSIFSENYSPELDPSYDDKTKTIYYDLYINDGKIYHEMFHRINSRFTGENKYGEFLDEGLNGFFTEQLFGSKTFPINTQYIKSLSYIIGTNNLYNIYMNGNIYDLENLFSKLISQDNANNLISNMDKLNSILYNFDINNDSNLLFQNINQDLINMYFTSSNDLTKNLKKSKEFISTLLYNIDLIGYMLIDQNSMDEFNGILREELNDDRLYKIYENLEIDKDEFENKNYLNETGNFENVNNLYFQKGGIKL